MTNKKADARTSAGKEPVAMHIVARTAASGNSMNQPSGPEITPLDIMQLMAEESRAEFVRQQQARKVAHDREFGILQLTALVDDYGYDAVACWLRAIGAALGPSAGTSLDPRR